MRLLLIILFSITWISVRSQTNADSKVYTRELGLTVDNDYPYETDQYYTAGHDLYYRFGLHPKNRLFGSQDSAKSIFSFHYGNKIFNPKNLDTDDIRLMDRPYCGWNFVGAELRNFKRKNSSNFFGLQVGLVGPASGMEQLQLGVHQAIHLYTAQGWDTQISNEVVVNTHFNHMHGFQLAKQTEIVSSTGVSAGTGTNKISQELTLRFLRFNPLHQSTFLNANLSSEKPGGSKPEFFFFASIGGDYVLSNIFIQGSLFNNNPSQFTTAINPWFFTEKFGAQYANRQISVDLTLVHLSKETPLVSTHNYARISVAYRF